jgi:hypothetical protein
MVFNESLILNRVEERIDARVSEQAGSRVIIRVEQGEFRTVYTLVGSQVDAQADEDNDDRRTR